uniref:Putative secreted protein n=1 Tax=Ixodes ricinus TaxID=34613 RepID=A0A6B0TUP5_IXORI
MHRSIDIFLLNLTVKLNRCIGFVILGHDWGDTKFCANSSGKQNSCLCDVGSISWLSLAGNAPTGGRTDTFFGDWGLR